MAFCMNCGKQLPDGAKFCSDCGTALGEIKPETSQRKTVYEGNLHKCPNCGELLESFRSHCPSCGYEIRNVRSVSSVQELAQKLENIDAQTMPHVETKKSIMEMVLGKDFKNKDEAEEAQERFETQKEEQKANLIINFSVPNTKEDVLEFMILASTNINVKQGLDDIVSEAWLSKLEQVYERAKMLMGDTEAFSQIKKIYDKKKAEIKNRKFKGFAIASYVIGGYALFLGLVIPEGGIIGVLIGIVLVMLGVKFTSIYNKNKRQNR